MKWHDEIARIARELYEKSGRIEGRDLDNWLKAERIVMERYKEQEKMEAEMAGPEGKKEKTSKKVRQKNRTKR